MAQKSPEKVTEDEYIQMMLYMPEKINKCISLLADNYIEDSNIKVYYMPYLINLKVRDGMSQKDLKCNISCDKSRISVVIHELIDLGFVYNDAKGRNSSLHLTEKGKKAYEVCKKFFEVVKKELFNLEMAEEVRVKDMEFNAHLDEVIKKYTH